MEDNPIDIYTFRLQYEIGKLNLLEQLLSMCECPEDVFNYSDKTVARNQMMGFARIIEQATDSMNEFIKACKFGLLPDEEAEETTEAE